MTGATEVDALIDSSASTDESQAGSRTTRSRGVIAVVVASLLASVVALAAAFPPLAAPPSLSVFDREPTEREREIEAVATAESGGIAPGAIAEARVIVDIELESGPSVLEVWALRSEVADALGRERTFVCLTTAPTGPNGDDLFSCMEEADVERRGFIPLDQPRPRVVVDGELRVIEWGPTGDARLVDPPKPPRRTGSGS